MSTIRVWDGGDGTDGLTWATAYQTLLAAVDSLTDADHTILVHYQHSETIAASVTYTGPLNVETGVFSIITVDKDNSDVYTRATSPNITTTGTASDIYFDGCFHVKGLSLLAGDDLKLDANEDEVFIGEELTLETPSNGWMVLGTSATTGEIDLFDSDLIIGDIAKYYHLTVIGGSITGSSTNGLFAGNSANATLSFIGVDLSSVAYTLFDNFSGSGRIKVVGCKLSSGISIFPSGDERNIRAVITASDDTTGNDIGRYEIHEVATGSITKSTGVYRTGGANDGSNDYSLLLSPGSYPHFADPLRTEWNEGYIDASGSKTLTVYIASSGILDNDDVWLEVMYFANSTDTQMALATTRKGSIIDSATDYPDDIASTWNGGSFSSKQKVSIATSVGRAGPFMWRFCNASNSDVYIDPKIEVT